MNATALATGLRVLVVDDCKDAAESLVLLTTLWGHDARAAHTGPEALLAADAFRPHVILLDIGIPLLSGHEVARRLRRQDGLKDVLLIATTGWGQDRDRQEALAAGFDHHFVKPLRLEELEQVLSARAQSVSVRRA